MKQFVSLRKKLARAQALLVPRLCSCPGSAWACLHGGSARAQALPGHACMEAPASLLRSAAPPPPAPEARNAYGRSAGLKRGRSLWAVRSEAEPRNEDAVRSEAEPRNEDAVRSEAEPRNEDAVRSEAEPRNEDTRMH